MYVRLLPLSARRMSDWFPSWIQRERSGPKLVVCGISRFAKKIHTLECIAKCFTIGSNPLRFINHSFQGLLCRPYLPLMICFGALNVCSRLLVLWKTVRPSTNEWFRNKYLATTSATSTSYCMSTIQAINTVSPYIDPNVPWQVLWCNKFTPTVLFPMPAGLRRGITDSSRCSEQCLLSRK